MGKGVDLHEQKENLRLVGIESDRGEEGESVHDYYHYSHPVSGVNMFTCRTIDPSVCVFVLLRLHLLRV